MANLVVDIGNTALKAAWTDRVTLGKTFRYQGEKMSEFILSLVSRDKPDVMVIASSREISDKDERKFRERCRVLVIMDPKHSEVAERNGLPSYLAPDRAASVMASRYLFRKKGCTLFDFGTTLTIDFLDAEGNYSGGNISLGCRTRFKALNRYSRSLPLADASSEACETGHDILSSIESGVIEGIIFEIEGYLRRYPDNINVFTGGDAIYFAKRMKNSIFVVCNLVLMGLALTAEDYV